MRSNLIRRYRFRLSYDLAILKRTLSRPEAGSTHCIGRPCGRFCSVTLERLPRLPKAHETVRCPAPPHLHPIRYFTVFPLFRRAHGWEALTRSDIIRNEDPGRASRPPLIAVPHWLARAHASAATRLHAPRAWAHAGHAGTRMRLTVILIPHSHYTHLFVTDRRLSRFASARVVAIIPLLQVRRC